MIPLMFLKIPLCFEKPSTLYTWIFVFASAADQRGAGSTRAQPARQFRQRSFVRGKSFIAAGEDQQLRSRNTGRVVPQALANGGLGFPELVSRPDRLRQLAELGRRHLGQRGRRLRARLRVFGADAALAEHTAFRAAYAAVVAGHQFLDAAIAHNWYRTRAGQTSA